MKVNKKFNKIKNILRLSKELRSMSVILPNQRDVVHIFVCTRVASHSYDECMKNNFIRFQFRMSFEKLACCVI